MNKYMLPICALAAGLTVVMGAMGAHALKSILLPAQLDNYETALRYQFFHLLAILLTALLQFHFQSVSFRWVVRLFATGILLFCGSIYLIIVFQHNQLILPRSLFLLTPLGGFCLTAGWLVLARLLFKAITQKVEN